MKIDIYTLLGLVKDGKQPNKIKYNGHEYKFYKDSEVTDYCFECFDGDEEVPAWLSTCIIYISDIFTDEVEIIEEPKKIEKMECSVESWFTPSQADIEIIKKINELIDEINNLKEKKDD